MHNDLIAFFKNYPSATIGYSGGVDSTLVAYCAKVALGDNARIVMFDTPLIAADELNCAIATAASLHFNLQVIEANPLVLDEVATNQKSRCYVCKTLIFSTLKEVYRGNPVFDGTNYDDTFTDRPGLKALKELGIISPLAQLHFTKHEVRDASRRIGLRTADKPSAPCLATRFECGHLLKTEELERVQKAESVLCDLGYTNLRIRDHGTHASIEVDPGQVEKLRENEASISKLLFPFYETIEIKKDGYRAGSA
ncbi:MAG: ATP-dependent sacrificial sulfur transferase LarE [Coriobacteriia bacterium]|nr:ATP-dependent sacrificial sulfur transferase LarE [Coriobacteriia bacterium]